MLNCTTEGQTLATTTAGIKEITVGTKSAETPRREIYGRAKVGGVMVYMQTTGTRNEYLHLVLALCDGPCQSIESVWFGSSQLTVDVNGDGTGVYAGKVRLRNHLGEIDQEADPDLIAESVGKWTSSHQMRGICYIYLRLTNWDPNKKAPHPALFEQVPDVSAIVEGLNDMAGGYTTNPAKCFNRYRMRRGLAEIEPVSLVLAAAQCDELVAGAPRFEVGGVVEMQASVEDVTRQFLISMNGTLSSAAGRHLLTVGSPTPPEKIITLDDLRGPMTLERTPGEKETVQATYQGEETGWANSDTVGAAVTARSLKLDLVAREDQAQRIEQTQNKKAGPTEKLSLDVGTKHIRLTEGDSVAVDLPPMAVGVFDVVSRVLSFGPTIGLSLQLERQRAGLYDDHATTPRTTETLDVSATTLPTPTIVSTSTGAPYPYDVTITAAGDAVIRYSFSGYPLTVDGGSPYFGKFVVSGATSLYVSIFKPGWNPAYAIEIYT